MNHKRIELSTGTVDIYDNSVPLTKRLEMLDWLQKDCGFYLGWSDRFDETPHLHAVVNNAYPQVFDLLENIRETSTFMERIVRTDCNLDCDKVIANLSTSASVHHSHTHPEKLVTLYYANLEWKEEWEGETMFFDEDGEVEFTSRYVPGRILIFDGSMPHTIRAQSHAGPHYRFSISYFWREANAPETQGQIEPEIRPTPIDDGEQLPSD